MPSVRHQSAALPVRVHPDKGLQFLLVSRSSGPGWVIPKGGVPSGLAPGRQAEIEAWEEAGVVGKVIDSPVGRFSYRKDGKWHRVQVYLMRVKKTVNRWPERRSRERRWVRAERAAKLAGHEEALPVLKQAVKKAKKLKSKF